MQECRLCYNIPEVTLEEETIMPFDHINDNGVLILRLLVLHVRYHAIEHATHKGYFFDTDFGVKL